MGKTGSEDVFPLNKSYIFTTLAEFVFVSSSVLGITELQIKLKDIEKQKETEDKTSAATISSEFNVTFTRCVHAVHFSLSFAFLNSYISCFIQIIVGIFVLEYVCVSLCTTRRRNPHAGFLLFLELTKQLQFQEEENNHNKALIISRFWDF